MLDDIKFFRLVKGDEQAAEGFGTLERSTLNMEQRGAQKESMLKIKAPGSLMFL